MLNLMRHRLRCWSMVAFLAVFGLAFAPTVSHALAHARGDAVRDGVCATGEMAATTAEGATPSENGPAAVLNHLSHCPLCGLATQGMAGPASPPPFTPPEGLGQAQPVLTPHAPPTLSAWPQAQPRAPPRLG